MKLTWFKRKGLFYIPVSIFGWLILLFALAFSVYRFIEIDNHSHSGSDALINFVFQLLIIGAVYSLIAYFTSKSATK